MIPWLSVIMPVHDGARFLGATLASAVAEQPDGVEFLLYDSGDDAGAARDVAASFADRLDIRWQATPDIRSWTSKTNLGAHEAQAEHICMLHQDDLWLPGHLTSVRAAITAEPGAAMSIASSRFVDASGKAMGSWRMPFASGPVAYDDFVSTLLVQNSIAVPSPAIRRDAWLAVGGMDEDLWYTADWDLYLRIALQGRIVVRGAETTAFRLHGSSLTMTGSRDEHAFRAQLETVLDRHLGSVPAKRRSRSIRLAKASIDVNCALAGAMRSRGKGLIALARALARLGPVALPAYLRQSRIGDRLRPRLQLRLARGL